MSFFRDFFLIMQLLCFVLCALCFVLCALCFVFCALCFVLFRCDEAPLWKILSIRSSVEKSGRPPVTPHYNDSWGREVHLLTSSGPICAMGICKCNQQLIWQCLWVKGCFFLVQFHRQFVVVIRNLSSSASVSKSVSVLYRSIGVGYWLLSTHLAVLLDQRVFLSCTVPMALVNGYHELT